MAAFAGNAGSAAKGQFTPKPIPDEGIYQQEQAGAQKAWDDAMASLKTKELGIQQQYGFNASGGVDGSNPYSQYFQLKNSQAGELNQAREMAMERNLGGKGLGAQVADQPRYQQGVEDANFQRAYLDDTGAIAEARTSASQTLQNSLQQSKWRQMDRAKQEEMWWQSLRAQEEAAFAQQQALEQWMQSQSQAQHSEVPEIRTQLYNQVMQTGYTPAASPAALKAADASMAASKKKGLSPAEAALMAQGAALNKMYGLG